MRTLDVTLALVRYEILGEELPSAIGEAISPEKLASLYRLSARHDLAHLVGDALTRCGLIGGEGDSERRFVNSRDLSRYRYTQMQHEYKRITEALSEGSVDFIPLKGAVVRHLYPKPWMRTSCDIDILVKPEALERAAEILVDKLGYKRDGEGTTHDYGFLSPSGVRLELHYRLLAEGDLGAELLSDVWSFAVPSDDDEHRYLLCDEAFYFFHIAHMAAHFQHGGCGIRTVLDLWLLNNKMDFDKEKRHAMLREGGLFDFALQMERLSDTWFADGEYDDFLREISDYIRHGGVYGSADNRIKVGQTKAGGRFKYLLSRIFISNDTLKKKYPILVKRPYLIPIYHVARWFKPLFSKKTKEKSLREVNVTREAKRDGEKIAELLLRLGL